MPCLGMIPTAKGMPISLHSLVFCREHTAFRTADCFQRVERFHSRQSRSRARTALVYRVTDNSEDDYDPEQ